MCSPSPKPDSSTSTSLLESIAICETCCAPIEFNNSWIDQQAVYLCPSLHVVAQADIADTFVSKVCIGLIERSDCDDLRLSEQGVLDIRSWWSSAAIAIQREVVTILITPMITSSGDISIKHREG